MSLLPRMHLPTAPVTRLNDIFRIPRWLRGKNYNATGKYILEQPKGAYAWISPKSELGGPEIEGIIRGGTWGKRVSNFNYTTYKGSVVPLPEFRIIDKGLPTGFTSKMGLEGVSSKTKEFFSLSYSGGTKNISLLNPSYLFSEAVSYSKPSSSFKTISSPSSSKSGGSSILSSYKSIKSSLVSYKSSQSSSISSSSSSIKSSINSSSSSIKSSISSSLSSIKSVSSSKKSSYKTPDYTLYPYYAPSKIKGGGLRLPDKQLMPLKYKFRKAKIGLPTFDIKSLKWGK